jgi:Asp-tRNA(Asn)/Glu-tRNA(Gln) amidotransferase A subunit family amidase
MPIHKPALLALLGFAFALPAQAAEPERGIDHDLLEVSIPQLENLYANHKYTVTQVVQWYVARIDKYNGIYRAIQTLDVSGAMRTAAQQDAAAAQVTHGPLWGVPIVIKANTSIEGLVTTDGWQGYKIAGHELIAPSDATIVAKLRAAGAVILGQTNMPDFAASDTNRSTAFGRTGNAYDVRFSPGGSSGGTVTAVTSNEAVLGTGTDTGNSIRMPSATSAVVGVFPTPGLVSIAGIAPLDWLLDNTGPIARNVTDAAIALGVMAGEDPLDQRTTGSAAKAQHGPYTQYLQKDALRGKRFGVPAFILHGVDTPFEGLDSSVPANDVSREEAAERAPLRPETRAAFMKAIDGLREAGATVVFDDSILPDEFARVASRIGTLSYVREGTEKFLRGFGPAQYHSAEEYQKAVGAPLPATILGSAGDQDRRGYPASPQALIENDPHANANFYEPRAHALATYLETLDRLHLDGYVYPAAQMPPPDETMPQDGKISGGPHSDTAWVNMIGVPAIVVSGGFYPGGLPFGLEISARPWKDGDLLGYAYAYEQATHHRHPPVLVESGLLPGAP